MNDARKAAEWMKASRLAKGWSTTRLAAEARAVAHANGYKGLLQQQTINTFELKGKKIPEWFRYAKMALENVQPTQAATTAGHVMLPVAIPSVEKLTESWISILEGLPEYPTLALAAFAEILAQHLPDVLSGGLQQMPVPPDNDRPRPTTQPGRSRGKSTDA